MTAVAVIVCRPFMGGTGQAQGLPLQDHIGGIATTVGEAREGRHKACPYGGGAGVRTPVAV